MITLAELRNPLFELLTSHVEFEIEHPPVDKKRIEHELHDIVADYLADLPLSTVMSLQLTNTLLDRVPITTVGTQLHFIIYEVLKEYLWEVAIDKIAILLFRLSSEDTRKSK